jgi:hypothetical protein
MYTSINFKTKKAMVEAFKSGQKLYVYQPGGMFAGRTDGVVCIEGPHYPQPHRWYAEVTIEKSVIVKIKGVKTE